MKGAFFIICTFVGFACLALHPAFISVFGIGVLGMNKTYKNIQDGKNSK